MTGTGYGRDFFSGLLEALARAMGLARGYLFLHGPRTAVLAAHLGRALGLGERESGELFLAALLSDAGMIGLGEEAWENPNRILSPEHRAEVNRHPERSSAFVTSVPHLQRLAPLILHHHEWWDGSGYPHGLRGEEIPIGSRVLRLADSVAAMGETRPQRPALPPRRIVEEVEESAGREFAPELVRLYTALVREGDLPPFSRERYLRERRRALEAVVPPGVSPLSSGELLEVFGNLVDAKDPYTGGHSRRVAALAALVSRALELPERVGRQARDAGHVHDIGKVGVPRRVLVKEGALRLRERRRVQRHVRVGAMILEGVPALRHLAPGCRYHHERWDGAGYAEGISGERIPMVARILAVCDAYDAMTSARAYRPARDPEEAVAEIRREAGAQFDPEVARAFCSLPLDALYRPAAALLREAPGPRPRAPS